MRYFDTKISKNLEKKKSEKLDTPLTQTIRQGNINKTIYINKLITKYASIYTNPFICRIEQKTLLP